MSTLISCWCGAIAIGIYFRWRSTYSQTPSQAPSEFFSNGGRKAGGDEGHELPIGHRIQWIGYVATPGELVRTVSSVLDLPEVTVSVYYRNLREAGLVTKGGRGPSAPSLTYLDASRLLIALMGSDTATQAAKEAKRYGRLQLTHLDRPAGDDVYSGFSSELFSKLNFEAAVEYILEIASEEHDEELITDEMYPLVISAKSDLSAEIHFWLHGYYDKLPSDWTRSETGALVSPSRTFRAERMPRGFLVQRSIGGVPLVRIARSIRP